MNNENLILIVGYVVLFLQPLIGYLIITGIVHHIKLLKIEIRHLNQSTIINKASRRSGPVIKFKPIRIPKSNVIPFRKRGK